MKYPSTCDYCGRTRFQFCDTGGVELYIARTPDDDYVIVVDGIRPGCNDAWSIPIHYCPYCGRELRGDDDA